MIYNGRKVRKHLALLCKITQKWIFYDFISINLIVYARLWKWLVQGPPKVYNIARGLNKRFNIFEYPEDKKQNISFCNIFVVYHII